MNSLAVAIAPENVSLLAKTDSLDDYGIEDKVLPVTEGASLRKMLMDEGADADSAAATCSTLSSMPVSSRSSVLASSETFSGAIAIARERA